MLTAVGLLPIATAGINIEEMMQGAADASKEYSAERSRERNQYAAVRNALYRKGKGIEILVNYEPSLHFVSEWWKRFTARVKARITRDLPGIRRFLYGSALHGSIYPGRRRNIFETVIQVENVSEHITIESDPDDLDGELPDRENIGFC